MDSTNTGLGELCSAFLTWCSLSNMNKPKLFLTVDDQGNIYGDIRDDDTIVYASWDNLEEGHSQIHLLLKESNPSSREKPRLLSE